jgi:hypothetical protein
VQEEAEMTVHIVFSSYPGESSDVEAVYEDKELAEAHSGLSNFYYVQSHEVL